MGAESYKEDEAMLATEHEPCKEQRNLMESLGFRLVMTDDNGKDFGKSTWVMHIKSNYGNGEFDVVIAEDPKAVPRLDTLLYHVSEKVFVLGKEQKTKEIHNVLGIPYGEGLIPDL